MSGYDLAHLLKQRFVPFKPSSHTQIYPALARLEEQGLVRHDVVDQHAVRPNKKVYELTEKGRAALRRWVESDTPLVIGSDEFYLKAYSLWVADPARMIERFHEQAGLHEEQLKQYQQALQSQQLAIDAESGEEGLPELSDVLFQYVIGYEQNYLAWCKAMLQYLEERRHANENEV